MSGSAARTAASPLAVAGWSSTTSTLIMAVPASRGRERASPSRASEALSLGFPRRWEPASAQQALADDNEAKISCTRHPGDSSRHPAARVAGLADAEPRGAIVPAEQGCPAELEHADLDRVD